MIVIRGETAGDVSAIHEVNVAAFDRPDEAELVDKLRQRGAFTVSLVAEVAGRVVGHLLFTPVVVVPEVQGTEDRATHRGWGPWLLVQWPFCLIIRTRVLVRS